jgi:hypothetical protein
VAFQLARHRTRAILIYVSDAHMRPFGRQQASRGRADARRAAGDQRYLAFEPHGRQD